MDKKILFFMSMVAIAILSAVYFSVIAIAVTPPACPEVTCTSLDFDHNGIINILDLQTALSIYKSGGSCSLGNLWCNSVDKNCDGRMDIKDLQTIKNAYGPCATNHCTNPPTSTCTAGTTTCKDGTLYACEYTCGAGGTWTSLGTECGSNICKHGGKC